MMRGLTIAGDQVRNSFAGAFGNLFGKNGPSASSGDSGPGGLFEGLLKNMYNIFKSFGFIPGTW